MLTPERPPLARYKPSYTPSFGSRRLREYVRDHLPALASQGVEIDPRALAAIGWTVSSFDDAVTLQQLGFPDAQSCEWCCCYWVFAVC